MKINPEVKKALEEGRPVVALESTIISHGMPYPKNVECALGVEKVIRDNGAIPATIGIIEGEPIVGMTPEEIELFGKTKGIEKVSRHPRHLCNEEVGCNDRCNHHDLCQDGRHRILRHRRYRRSS